MNLTDQAKPIDGGVADLLHVLTPKQREVLDLLIKFKTSKEISRILAISPHTVDQRVDAAKSKLGASSRNDLALRYRELIGDDAPIYERTTYDESHIASASETPQNHLNAEIEALASNLVFDMAGAAVSTREERDYRVVPELFDGQWGTIARLVTILAVTILLCIAFLGGLTILIQTSRLLEG